MTRFRRQRGFTLLEALVSLTVVALIATVLMQALTYTLDLRERLLRHQAGARIAALQEQWFRDSLAAATPDLPDALGILRGSAERIELLSASPLGGGGLQPVRWQLVPVAGGAALHYDDPQLGELSVVEGPLRNAAFSYLDSAGQWHETWPSAQAPDEVLPRLLRLQAESADGAWVWMVALTVDPRVAERLRPEEALDGF